jgi:hypothetical protein
MKPNKIVLPHKQVGLFVAAAHSWLLKEAEAKDNNLEIAFQATKHKGQLRVSAGASAQFIEAIIPVDPACGIEFLKEPIFLDLQVLSAYKFHEENLTMTIPLENREDQRISFSAQGFNFRIPRKQGVVWQRNEIPMDTNIPHFKMGNDIFQTLMTYKKLPNVYGTADQLRIMLAFSKQNGLQVSACDGMGALYHVFKDEALAGAEGVYDFSDKFFTPAKKLTEVASVLLGQNENQVVAQAVLEDMTLSWTMPRGAGLLENVPAIIEKHRAKPKGITILNLSSFLKDLAKSFTFLSNTEMSEGGTHVTFIGEQYTIKTNKQAGQGETEVTGQALAPASCNFAFSMSNKCIDEYVACFDKDSKAALNLEALNSVVYFSQNTEGKFLSYLAPLPFGGGN